MKKLSLIILLLISFSWLTSLAEGLRCEEEDRHESSQVWTDTADAHDMTHVCHAGSCHFGHCAHLYAKAPPTTLGLLTALGDRESTPYAFSLLNAPFSLQLRPPVAV